MSMRCAAKRGSQQIKVRVEVHKYDYMPYNDRTVELIFLNFLT